MFRRKTINGAEEVGKVDGVPTSVGRPNYSESGAAIMTSPYSGSLRVRQIANLPVDVGSFSQLSS